MTTADRSQGNPASDADAARARALGAGLVLAIDCSGGACSAALSAGGELKAAVFEPMRRGHSEALAGLVDGLMRETGTGYAELDVVAATAGPGSFTGLRIALAFGHGVARAAGAEIVGVSAFDILTAAVERHAGAVTVDRPLLHAIDSRRSDFYAALQGGSDGLSDGLSDLGVMTAADLANAVPGTGVSVVGDGTAALVEAAPAVFRPLGPAALSGPLDARDVAVAALVDLARGLRRPPRPTYYRAAEAVRPVAGGRLRPE